MSKAELGGGISFEDNINQLVTGGSESIDAAGGDSGIARVVPGGATMESAYFRVFDGGEVVLGYNRDPVAEASASRAVDTAAEKFSGAYITEPRAPKAGFDRELGHESEQFKRSRHRRAMSWRVLERSGLLRPVKAFVETA